MKQRLNDYYYRISMKKKWIIFICVTIIYQIVLIGYFGYKNYEEVIEDHFIQSVQKDVGNITEQVSDRLKSLEEFAMKLQYDEYIYSFIQEKEYSLRASLNTTSRQYKSIPEYEFKRSVERHLNSVLLSRPEIQLASLQFVTAPENTYTVTRKKSYAEELSFAEINIYEKKLESDTNTVYYMDINKDIYIVQKIISRGSFQQAATIVLKIDRAMVLEKLEEMLEGAKKGVYVVGLGNKEILVAGDVSTEHKHKVLQYFKESNRPDMYSGANPKNEIIVYDTIETTNQNIGVAVLIFKDILLADVRATSRQIILVSFITIPFFLLLAYKLYKDIIHPVYDLSAKMKQIQEGEMGVLIETTRSDEIGVLFRSFNKMSNKINYLVNRVYKEQLAFKNSEIRALQAQINPHFLYNTLELINWSARLQGADDVAEMIEALGGIMEVNIDRKDERFLTVQEELKYTNHYIFLIKKRFGDKIQFEQEIEEGVMARKVPRLILQPMIENAIEHGVEPIGRGKVTIRMYTYEDMLMIEIQDSGQGIEKDVIEEMQYNLEHWDAVGSEKVESTSKGKIGVLNVHSRLRLIYGKHSGIQVSSNYGEGTRITMRIPTTEEDDR